MAKNSYKGAIQKGGILQQQSGDDLTIIQQMNGVIRVKPMTPKRKRSNQAQLVYTTNVNHFY